jgi:hypothetical protein
MTPSRSLLAILIATLFSASFGWSADKIQYNRDIRPILAENCFSCHGQDSASRKAKLRLDQREPAIESGSIKPGSVKESELITRIVLPDDDEQLMPPKNSHKKLTAAQKEVLKKWIEQGAEYQPHWSFIPAQMPKTPVVKDAKWVRNPIDGFILAELENMGLTPAAEADRRTLARRASLDITGLPPTPEDVERFVNDKSDKAYETYLDQLFASPQYGEHRARFWLDAARYADTHGIHFDNYREIWAYRDWVIRAFNQNKKFDQFTTEQLAGDLLPNATVEQKVATGFNRCNITTNEGGVIAEEYLVMYTRDRTETASTVFLGLTLGCAVCHDHKYDPVTQKDFYSLSAFFNNTTQGAMDGNIPNSPPVMTVPLPDDEPRLKELETQIAQSTKAVQSRKTSAKPEFTKWLASAKAEEFANKIPTDHLVLHAPLKEDKGNVIKLTVNGKPVEKKFTNGYDWSINRTDKQKAFTVRSGETIEFPEVGDFEKNQPYSVSAWVSISKRGTTGAIVARMNEAEEHRGWDLWIEADKIGMHLINNWPGDALKVVAKQPLQPGKWTYVTMTYDGTAKASGVKIFYDGNPIPFDIQEDKLKSTTRTAVPFKIGQRHTQQRVNGVSIEELRLYDRALTTLDVQQLNGSRQTFELLSKPADKRSPKEVDELFNWWLVTQDAAYKTAASNLKKLQEEEASIRGRGTIAHVSVEKPSMPEAFMLFRGEYDKRRDKVGPVTPSALPKIPDNLPKNRLGLAQWLLQKDHPMTARVTVNRFWQEIFGTGIVRTTGDFGVSGELPSHPELIDWLALDFQKDWDIKRFLKQILMSNTYRQSATVTKEKLEKDRDNRFLSRGPRFRMDAEMIRDYALSVSGLLVPKLGGPSVKPYQPDGVWEAVAMIGSNTRDYRRDSGDKLYRRSMYTFWKRSAPPASMEIFNAPNRETCTVRRDRTNTPLQALVTLNDIQFVEAHRNLAEKAMNASKTDAERIDFIAKRILSRSFSKQELPIVEGSLAELRKEFTAKKDEAKKLISFGESKADAKLDPSELAAFTMLINELMNLDEVLCK